VTLPGVLVVGSRSSSDASDLVFEAGLAPVVRETILSAIETLRKERFLALIVDGDTAEIDILELVLNVRDVDPGVRIYLLPGRRSDLAWAGNQPRVSVVDREELKRKLTPTPVQLDEARRRPPQAGKVESAEEAKGEGP
jgi:hypothetical protein